MKYIEQLHSAGSYKRFLFTSHDANDLCIGDQIWSDGKTVEVYDMCDHDLLENLISEVENKAVFKEALRNSGF